MELAEKMAFFSQMISCNQSYYLWHFDEQGGVIESNCPDAGVFLPLLRHIHSTEYITSVQEHTPILMTDEIGFTLVADRMWEGEAPNGFYLIGPCFMGSISQAQRDKRLEAIFSFTSGTREWKERLLEQLPGIPTASFSVLIQLSVMLHYCINGEKRQASDIHYQQNPQDAQDNSADMQDAITAHRNEQALMKMVQEGNPHYAAIRSKITANAKVYEYTANPLDNHKIACTIFTSLCARAAIQGGLSSQNARSLSNQYIQRIWEGKTVSGVAAVNQQMYRTFVDRVHDLHEEKALSPMIRSCVDYIALHIEEKVNIETLASRFGYTKYYLSRCFKQETGQSVNDYIRDEKIHYAKFLLETTEDSVDQIAERLCFSSSSFFSDTFKRVTGTSASQYRKEHYLF